MSGRGLRVDVRTAHTMVYLFWCHGVTGINVNNNDDDGDGAMSDKVDNDCNSVTEDDIDDDYEGVMGDDDNDRDGPQIQR